MEILSAAVGRGSADRNTHFNLGVATLHAAGGDLAAACFRRAGSLRVSPLSWQAWFDPQAH